MCLGAEWAGWLPFLGTDVGSQKVLVRVPSGGKRSGTHVGYVSALTPPARSERGGWGGIRTLTLASVAPLVQVNVGILVAVTRVISQISADNYKIHGDPSAFK